MPHFILLYLQGEGSARLGEDLIVVVVKVLHMSGDGIPLSYSFSATLWWRCAPGQVVDGSFSPLLYLLTATLLPKCLQLLACYRDTVSPADTENSGLMTPSSSTHAPRITPPLCNQRLQSNKLESNKAVDISVWNLLRDQRHVSWHVFYFYFLDLDSDHFCNGPAHLSAHIKSTLKPSCCEAIANHSTVMLPILRAD